MQVYTIHAAKAFHQLNVRLLPRGLTAVATWYHKAGPLSPEEIASRYAELALAMVGHVAPAAGTTCG